MNFFTPASVRSSSGPSVGPSGVSTVSVIQISSCRAAARAGSSAKFRPALTIEASLPNRSRTDSSTQCVAFGFHAFDRFHASTAVKAPLGGLDGVTQRRHSSECLEGVRPLGSGERGRYIRTEERRARFESRLVDLAKQRAESVSRQMACEGFGVKVIGLESKANDFLGQLIERRIGEAMPLEGLQMLVQPMRVVDGGARERRGQRLGRARQRSPRGSALRGQWRILVGWAARIAGAPGALARPRG